MNKRVFVGIPTLNRPAFVQEAIRSVLAQTYTDFEVVVSDNYSDGDISQAVSTFVHECGDSRVRFYQQPANVGEYGQGRYFFGESSRCGYFMILHDDDVLHPDYLRRAVSTMEREHDADVFVANPYLFGGDGTRSDAGTANYLRDHCRTGRDTGPFDILSLHLSSGFAPISGTVIRRTALDECGFVDDDCHGNYPFEANVFLRLGEYGKQGWFQREELLGFRFHEQSLRNYLNLMENRAVVDTMVRIFSRRRFTGPNETKRRVILSRLRRAQALMATRDRDVREARNYIRQAISLNPRSPKAWCVASAITLAPFALQRFQGPAPDVQISPAPQMNSKNRLANRSTASNTGKN